MKNSVFYYIIALGDDVSMKMPPIEKIPEAYTAVEDTRVTLFDDYAIVKSSNGEKEYLIKWKGDTFYSNDNSTYWQGYIGYPVIAVLMLQGKLSLNEKVSKYFKNVNWNELNKKNKRDYHKSLEDVIVNVDENTREEISDEINRVYEEIKKLNITLSRKKDFS